MNYKGFKARGDFILSLVPKSGADSDPESDNEIELDQDEESAERALATNFEIHDNIDEENEIEDIISEMCLENEDDLLPELLNEEPVVQIARKKRKKNNSSPTIKTPRRLPENKKEMYLENEDDLLPGLLNEEPVVQIARKKRKKNNSSPTIKTPRRLPKNKKEEVFSWTEEDFEFPVSIAENTHFTAEDVKTPLQYFKMFFSDNLFELIVANTNLYSVQQTTSSVNTNKSEIESFLGIEILMGIVNMPSYRDYWSQAFRYNKIADVMPLKRYEALRRNLHFVDNDNMNNDRYFKIRPVLDFVRENCLKIPHEKRMSIDEMMIPYKGKKAGNRRQYVKNKPKKWGYKMFVRAGVSGIVYDFCIYAGGDTFSNYQFNEKEEGMGIGSKVVLSLCQSIPEKPNTAVYFDNFFSSLELLSHLREEYGILGLGTIRENRLKGFSLISDKEMKKRGRGFYKQVVDNAKKLALVKWHDNKSVLLCSSFVDSKPEGTIRRYSKDTKSKIAIPCPNIVQQYNSHMGGVDLADMLVSLYRTKYKSHRWYLGIFIQLVDVSINNASLLYRRHLSLADACTKYMPLKEFRHHVASSLLLANKSKRGRPSNENVLSPRNLIQNPTIPRPNNEIRYDAVGHFPMYTKKGRCRYCPNGQTAVLCQKCQVRLCFVESRNCFYNFHVR